MIPKSKVTVMVPWMKVLGPFIRLEEIIDPSTHIYGKDEFPYLYGKVEFPYIYINQKIYKAASLRGIVKVRRVWLPRGVMISGSFRYNNHILDWPGFQPGGIRRGEHWHGVLREEQRKMEVINDTEIESNCNGPLDESPRAIHSA